MSVCPEKPEQAAYMTNKMSPCSSTSFFVTAHLARDRGRLGRASTCADAPTDHEDGRPARMRPCKRGLNRQAEQLPFFNRPARWWLPVCLFVLGIAFGLRLISLADLHLWGDEAWSLYAYHIGPARLTVETGRDIHPPLYYYTVLAWVSLAGRSEFALRYLSLWAGVLLVAVVGASGRRLVGARAGVLASLVTGLAPFAVYYSQEVRPFIWVMLWCTMAFYVLLRALDGARRAWIGYAILTVLAAFTSYPTAFWFALHGLFILWHKPWRRYFRLWLGIEAAVLALAVPWLLIFGRAIQAHLTGQGAFTGRQPMSLPALLARSWEGFVAGTTWSAGPSWVVLVGIGVLSVVGVGLVWRSCRRTALWMIALAALPIMLFYPVHRRFSWFEPRVLAFCAVPLYVFIALGIDGWWTRRRWLGMTAVVLLIAVWGYGLSEYWTRFDRYNPDLEDYFPMLAHIQAHARPDDLVLYNANWHVGYFYAYYRAPLPEFQPFLDAPFLKTTPVGPRQVWVILRDVERRPGGGRVEDQIEDRLGAIAFKDDERWFGHIRVTRYVLPPSTPPERHMLKVGLDGIILDEFAVQPALTDGRWVVRAGESVFLTLTWHAVRPLEQNYHVFVHIIGPYNPRTGGPVWAQHDGVPGNQEMPTPGWPVGSPVADRHVLWVDAETPPDDGYVLEVGMYDPTTGARLPVIGPDGQVSDHLVLFPVQVVNP